MNGEATNGQEVTEREQGRDGGTDVDLSDEAGAKRRRRAALAEVLHG